MSARILRVDPASYHREDLAPAARALAEGALVAYPTETVYAIGARADDTRAAERLGHFAPGEPPLRTALHAASVEAALRRTGRVPARALALIRRFWPGPLTIVFSGQAVGLRVPALPIASDLLSLVESPVEVALGPGAPGPPLTSAAGVLERFGEVADWIVDAGETPLCEPSTVVRVSDEGWECLRDGIVTRDMLARHLSTTIVFVCTGNSCRSPMAEALFRRMVARRLETEEDALERIGVRIVSAGTSAVEGGPASATAVRIMEERAIDLSRHRSRTIDEDLVDRATAIYALSPAHAASLKEWWPEHAAKVFALDEQGIIDPIGGSQELYRQCAEAIERRLEDLLDRLFPRHLLFPGAEGKFS